VALASRHQRFGPIGVRRTWPDALGARCQRSRQHAPRVLRR
jgi:hypothetical protein